MPLLEDIATTSATWTGQFAVASTGTLAFVPNTFTPSERVLVWVDRLGREEPISAEPRAYRYVRLSPDGSKLAVSATDEQQDLWVHDLASETLTRVTFGAAVETYPIWMPDSRGLVFDSGPTAEWPAI